MNCDDKESKILDSAGLSRTIQRMAHEIIEKNHGVVDLVIIGIKTRGAYLAERIAKKMEEVEGKSIPVGALIRVVAYAKLSGEILSVEFAKKTLQGMIMAEEKRINVDYIQKIVADYCGIKETDMKTRKRSHAVAYPRQIAMYLSRKLTDHSFPDIGSFFGGRDHTTVLHACEKIRNELDSIEETRNTIEKLTSLIKKWDLYTVYRFLSKTYVFHSKKKLLTVLY